MLSKEFFHQFNQTYLIIRLQLPLKTPSNVKGGRTNMFNSSWGCTKNSSEMRATEEELLFRNGTALEHKITIKRSLKM